MIEPYRTAHFDTSGTTTPQQPTNGLRITKIESPASTQVATPFSSPVVAHVRLIKQTNPVGNKYQS